jgi:23S rRNA A1618 N6-methylase RlmF
MKRGNNEKIHPRNIYKDNTPNFNSLSLQYPSFSKFVTNNKGKCSVNWKDPLAVIELTKALLHRDFGIQIELPEEQLCPTVTSRLNYILWIEDLLGIGKGHLLESNQKKRKLETANSNNKVIGIDIGTGMKAILLS